MTRKLYWEDAYTKEFDAVVKQIDGNRVILDQTAFYPTSGGQLNDLGKVMVGEKEYNVTDVKEENGEVVHVLDKTFESQAGSQLKGRVDWERRYSLMRYHTALHVVCAVVEKGHGGGWKGGMIYVDKAHVDFDLPALNKELAAKIIDNANAVIAEGHKVYSKFITQEEALENSSLAKTEPGRELIKKLDTVRVVEIENFDIQMDGGTHVLNTSEIGKLRLAGFDNKGSHRKRIEMILE
jgi:misacylated tRNA(Ala) deacylase